MIWPAKLTIFAFHFIQGDHMKFKVGDRVNFLNDIGGGTVSHYSDHGQVVVLTNDGFEIPVFEKELVFSGNFSIRDDQASAEPKPQATRPSEPKVTLKERPVKSPELPANVPADSPVHIMLGFIPESNGPVFSSNIALYLINDSAYAAYYRLGEKSGGVLHHLASGFIEADTKDYIAGFNQTAISKISDMHLQFLFICRGKYSRKEPLDKMVNLNLVNFSKESFYRENDYFQEKAVLFTIEGNEAAGLMSNITIPEEILELERNAETDRLNKNTKKETPTDTLEIDLHMDEAALNSNLMPSAIIALQMSRFHAAIEEAISKNIRRLVVIHGLGQGTLKMQIRKELQEKYPEFIYQDASFKEYGFGATMVHLKFE
jgi:hypothetical protein